LPKDAAALSKWQTLFEGPLASAFPDARCPYVWLDPSSQGPDFGVLETFDRPWAFADFKEEWDYPDDSKFGAWFEERIRSRRQNARTSEDLKPYCPSACKPIQVDRPHMCNVPTPARAVAVPLSYQFGSSSASIGPHDGSGRASQFDASAVLGASAKTYSSKYTSEVAGPDVLTSDVAAAAVIEADVVVVDPRSAMQCNFIDQEREWVAARKAGIEAYATEKPKAKQPPAAMMPEEEDMTPEDMVQQELQKLRLRWSK